MGSPISEERVPILRPPSQTDFLVSEYIQAGAVVGLLLPPLLCLLQENSAGADSPALMGRRLENSVQAPWDPSKLLTEVIGGRRTQFWQKREGVEGDI